MPDCAADLPVPPGVSLVEVTAVPDDDASICVVTLASDAPVDEVTAAWRASLDGAGIAHVAEEVPGQRSFLRMEGPVCGSVLAYAAGTERVTAAVEVDRTPVLASVLPCELMPGGAPSSAGEPLHEGATPP